MFRKLYWVAETMADHGPSVIHGVYTSIPDLIEKGLPASSNLSRLRLTLIKLDSSKPPLGTWHGPEFHGLDEELQTYVKTEEFSPDQCQNLLDALHPVAAR